MGAQIEKAAIQKATDAIEEALKTCAVEQIKDLPVLQQAIAMAQGIQIMRQALTIEVVERLLMPLQGSPLGFRTDKDTGQGYDPATVRDCAIEAMIRGFNVVGNEFNIIAGRAYFTREGLDRKVAEFPGVTDFEFDIGVPHAASDKGSLVPCRAKWKLNDIPGEIICELSKDADGNVIDRRIPVRVNGGMGADAVLGKAKRKLFARVLERFLGKKLAPQDGDVFDTTAEPAPAPAPPSEDGKRIKMNGNKKNGAEQPPPTDMDPKTGEMPMRQPGEEG